MRRQRSLHLKLANARGAAARLVDKNRDDAILFAIGQLQTRVLAGSPLRDLRDSEFKVFSQFGEDGVIQHLLKAGDVQSDLFVEIGVGDYSECNTRFLLMNNNWRGVIVDADNTHINGVRKLVGWRYTVDAIQSLVTCDNINDLLPREAVGLLSIDVDGNDFWLWEAVESQPEIVIVEYNSIFGPEALVTVPYDAGFSVGEAHWSQQYHGASLGALEHLARKKGYQLVGATSEAVNAFFVRKDCLGSLAPVSVADAWRPSRFRTSHTESRKPSHISDHRERLRLIAKLPLVDVVTGEITTVEAACMSEERP